MTRAADALAELEAAESEMGFATERLTQAIDAQSPKQHLVELAGSVRETQGAWTDRVRKAITAMEAAKSE